MEKVSVSRSGEERQTAARGGSLAAFVVAAILIFVLKLKAKKMSSIGWIAISACVLDWRDTHAASVASKLVSHLPNAIVPHPRCQEHGGDIRLMSILIQLLRKREPSPFPSFTVFHLAEMLHSACGSCKLRDCVLKIQKRFQLKI
jgi:hypothetical protein